MADTRLTHRDETRDTAREIASRQSDGISVRLVWHAGDHAVWVSVSDALTGDRFQVAVPPDRAMHAFDHPFAYAA